MIDHEKTERAARFILTYSKHVLIALGVLYCLNSLFGTLVLFLPLGSLMYLRGKDYDLF
jgi:hypothetical protein